MSDSDDDHYYEGSSLRSTIKLKQENFLTWKASTLAYAKAGRFERFLLEDVQVLNEDEIDDLNMAYIDANPDDSRATKLARKEWQDEKRKSKLAAKAEQMMINSCSSMAARRKLDTCTGAKAMFDALCQKYGRQNESDLTSLVEELDGIKIKTMKKNPDDFFSEIDQLNDLIDHIDPDQHKNNKAIAIIITKNLHAEYKSVKSSIQCFFCYDCQIEPYTVKVEGLIIT